jgi:predicted acylesterase/phospholipase RssA
MIRNLVFAGGAFKGWAYIGTIQALNEYINILDIENVAGTSIGSIFGFFYILKIPWEYLLESALQLNFSDLIDINIDQFINNQSLIKGEKFKEWVQNYMKDYVDPNITYKELKKHTHINFTATALNISTGEVEYFNSINTPNVKVIDSIIASCSIPVLLPLYKIKEYYYCDGGLCNNFPTNLFDDLFTIGFDLCNDKIININDNNISLFNVISCLINIANKNYKSKRENIFNVIDSYYENQSYNIKQTKDDIFSLYLNGYTNSKNIIFDNFIALKN